MVLQKGADYAFMHQAYYTRSLFILSKIMLFLCEKRFSEANPLLQQISPDIENWVISYQVSFLYTNKSLIINPSYFLLAKPEVGHIEIRWKEKLRIISLFFVGCFGCRFSRATKRVPPNVLPCASSLLLPDGGSGQVSQASSETVTTINTGRSKISKIHHNQWISLFIYLFL